MYAYVYLAKVTVVCMVNVIIFYWLQFLLLYNKETLFKVPEVNEFIVGYKELNSKIPFEVYWPKGFIKRE